MIDRIVIVGASQAGAGAAAALRHEGYDGQIVLIGAEPELPYERPPLSKDVLAGSSSFDMCRIHSEEFYRDTNIDLELGCRVNSVDTHARTLALDDGRSLGYDRLLISTGVTNRKLPVPGAELDGVFGLRSAGECLSIQSEMRPGRHAVVIGMGFIGAEIAASMRGAGIDVTVVEPLAGPMARALRPDVSDRVAALHRAHGVVTHFNEGVEQLEGGSQVERVVTSSGRVIECDFVIVGVGVVPAVGFLEGSGIHLDNGVLVDENCRTNVEGVFAAGDVANHLHPLAGKHIRVEHWQNAVKQSAIAAKNMVGASEAYDAVHWFWSDQYDLNLQYAGFHDEPDDVVVRGDLDGDGFSIFGLTGGLVRSVLSFNRSKECRTGLKLIGGQQTVDATALADIDTDLRRLARRR